MSALLNLRSLAHRIAPNLAGLLEDWRKTELYRRHIRRHGFLMPLPPFIKRSIILRYALDHNCKTLVETGTQYGDTPWLFRNCFETIYTIELSPTLAAMARRRFRHLNHISVVEGDSSEKLSEVLPRLRSKTLFWLDGHYSAGLTARGSKDCPIYAELQSIFSLCKVPYVVLIDDARCFGKDKDYPSLQDLGDFVRRALLEHSMEVNNDIIGIIPLTNIGQATPTLIPAGSPKADGCPIAKSSRWQRILGFSTPRAS